MSYNRRKLDQGHCITLFGHFVEKLQVKPDVVVMTVDDPICQRLSHESAGHQMEVDELKAS